jgi:hypothetical protein
MNAELSDYHQLNAIFREGLATVPDTTVREAADLLEERSVETGLAAPLFVAEALRSVLSLLAEHESAGGVRVGFLQQLDLVLRPLLREIQQGDPLSATRRARELRDSVRQAVRRYDPAKEYE